MIILPLILSWIGGFLVGGYLIGRAVKADLMTRERVAFRSVLLQIRNSIRSGATLYELDGHLTRYIDEEDELNEAETSR